MLHLKFGDYIMRTQSGLVAIQVALPAADPPDNVMTT
jgi:hypothetical protein